MTDCFDADHFVLDDAGLLRPQPWMQYRHVGSVEAKSRTAFFKASGGGAKNELLHNLTLGYLNDTPIPQLVYGLITRGGTQVTLQARSRGYLQVDSGYAIGSAPGPLVPCSFVGVGGDAGKAGTLAIGTGFLVTEIRQSEVTFPLAIERPGWQQVEPAETLTAGVQVRFVAPVWESTMIDGGDTGTESLYVSGDTRLDLFAVPVIE